MRQRLIVIACFVVGVIVGFAAIRADAEPPITGTPQGDHIAGTSANDVIRSYGGDDVIRGRDGDDFLFGGSGDDTIHPGPGIDVVRCGTGFDVVVLKKERQPGYEGWFGCEAVIA